MNILMVGLHYHDYTRGIATEFERMGHSVTLCDIQPRSLPWQILRNVWRKGWERALHRHHEAILRRETGKRYDMVLFIQVHQMEEKTLDTFRKTFADARFVLYNWDSIDNHDYRPWADRFDSVNTFDPDDAASHGYNYLPLFCLRDFQFEDDPRGAERGVYFVGNLAKLPRYHAVMGFRDFCEARGITFKHHLATTPPVKAQLVKSGHVPRGLASGPIAKDDFIAMMKSVTATFDYANHEQTGYTMRVIENLCARRKIITNNPRIKAEPFYSPDRIHVFEEGDGYEGVEAFLQRDLAEPERTFPEYHIQTFARHLIDGTSHTVPAS